MKLVALTGKRGSGKDTAAKALVSNGYTHINFADPLRAIVTRAYGITQHEMMDPVLKETVLDRYPFKSPREVLTHVGTESFRSYIDDTWVQALLREAHKYGMVVISDLRFLNEEKMLRKNEATIIRIINPRRVDTDAVSQHRSEMEMDEIVADHTIINDGTIADLHRNVLDIPGVLPFARTYRSRTTLVRATQWFKEGDHHAVSRINTLGFMGRSALETPTGPRLINPGDWVIQSSIGFYVCSAESFDTIYEPVSA